MPITQSNTPAMTRSQPATARIAAMLRILAVWGNRRRSRASLAQLAPHLLRDIGLDAQSASGEAAKPFWKD